MSARPRPGNLFTMPGSAGNGEQLELLLSAGAFRLERIVSFGAASPKGFWYDQDLPEWVLLACGQATLAFDDGHSIDLEAGDYLSIPAGRRHRVASTSTDAIWLALHFTP